MCDKAVDDSLASLKLVTHCFVTSKIVKNRYNALYPDDNFIYFNGNCDDVVFCCNEMSIISIDLNNIHLDNNSDENDPDTIILIRFLRRYIKFGIIKDGRSCASQRIRTKK